VLDPISSYSRAMIRVMYEAERKELPFLSHIIGSPVKKNAVSPSPL
jgi:hypothetical protein